MRTLREDDISAALDSIALVEAKLRGDGESHCAIMRAAEHQGPAYLSHLVSRSVMLTAAILSDGCPVAIRGYLDGYRAAVLDDEANRKRR